ncbi:non-heme iron oxygenase ferredoxin subunit [Candidatus Woesearchaeota archaeon]|nr:non-heme iron oxygenase ferredoxin subunit [Candidatus Woesearchaeota archaeon]
MSNFVRVASILDLKPGENKVVEVNGEQVGLFNVDGEFYAISNTCAHRGGPLGEGYLEGDIVTCPWHGWRFNVKTGNNAIMPGVRVPSYQVKVEGSDVFVSID